MRVIVFLDHEYLCKQDGTFWTKDQFLDSFWARYLEVFSHVLVVARGKKVTQVPDDWHQIRNPRVRFIPVPSYLGFELFLVNCVSVVTIIWRATNIKGVKILRVPGTLSLFASLFLALRRDGFALEVMGDPWDSFSPGTMRHLLRPIFRRLFALALRWQCTRALGASYVTKSALQRRYPPRADIPTASYSSIVLRPEHFSVVARASETFRKPIVKLICIGTFNVLYKAQDILVQAVAICLMRGLRCTLTLVGDGPRRRVVESLVEKLTINSSVAFLGKVAAGDRIRDLLDGHDCFVLPSRQEGLPRAMIEAMARGLPCIGTAVGGIPELLPKEFLVPPGDPKALADRIESLIREPEACAEASARNRETARAFLEDHLSQIRVAYYSALCSSAPTVPREPR